jgi:hypothetical protein
MAPDKIQTVHNRWPEISGDISSLVVAFRRYAGGIRAEVSPWTSLGFSMAMAGKPLATCA